MVIYGPLEGRTVHFTDRKQELRPAGANWKATRRYGEGFPMYFLTSFRFY